MVLKGFIYLLIEFNVHQRCWNKRTPPPLLHCLSERGGQWVSFLDNVYNKNTFSQILQLALKPFTWRRDFLAASTDFQAFLCEVKEPLVPMKNGFLFLCPSKLFQNLASSFCFSSESLHNKLIKYCIIPVHVNERLVFKRSLPFSVIHAQFKELGAKRIRETCNLDRT